MSDMNLEQARFNMVEQQIRPWDVLDQTILDLVGRVKREDFVPEAYHNLAFGDFSIPLEHSEVMMAPKLEARMLQALNIQPNDTALEIGTGSGYVTALLASLARYVYSVDIHEDFIEAAKAKLSAHGLYNVGLEVADAAQGWDRKAPYDVIAVTGSLPALPEHLQESLSVGGRLFVVVGDSPVMEAILITRVSEDDFRSEVIFETDLPSLSNAVQPDRFKL